MLGSEILDVAIGLALVFLLMSFIATAIREAFETVIKARAVYLERGIRELLSDPEGTGLARAFYEHPLVYPLFLGGYEPKRKRFFGGTLPTYVPSSTFSAAIIDLTIRGPVQNEYAVMQTKAQLTVAALRENVGRLKDPLLMRAVLTASDHAGDDVSAVRKNLESWFDSAMDRVSGRYKRFTQFWLFAIGLVLAALLNVNTITIVEHLSHDKAMREALVARATTVMKDPQYRQILQDTTLQQQDLQRVTSDLRALDLPIGLQRYRTPVSLSDWVQLIAGIFITGLAVTLGAPFWFDALNKMMVVRSTVKPDEKSGEEGSKDRPVQPRAAAAAPPPPPPPPAQRAESVPDSSPAPQAAPVIGPAGGPDNQWNAGPPDEGIL